jgi:hypothetical protein
MQTTLTPLQRQTIDEFLVTLLSAFQDGSESVRLLEGLVAINKGSNMPEYLPLQRLDLRQQKISWGVSSGRELTILNSLCLVVL